MTKVKSCEKQELAPSPRIKRDVEKGRNGVELAVVGKDGKDKPFTVINGLPIDCGVVKGLDRVASLLIYIGMTYFFAMILRIFFIDQFGQHLVSHVGGNVEFVDDVAQGEESLLLCELMQPLEPL